MKLTIVAVLSLLLTQGQTAKETIEGRVVHPGSHEPIADVLITLTAPPPANATSNLAADVQNRLNQQISDLTESGIRAGVSQQAIDNAIENARRNAGAAQGRQITAMTDASGRFSFHDLAPGRYSLRAEKEGYFAQPVNGNAPPQANKSILLQEGKPAAMDDIFMVKGSVIAGHVRDPNNQPISGMNVSVYRVTYNQGRKQWSALNTKSTDDRGEFRIFWMFPGEYYVGVTPRTPGTIPGPQDSWARTFYPGVTETAEATPIVLKDGTEASGIDITIRTSTAATFKISGIAINPTARPNPTSGAVDRSIASFVLAPREPGVLDAINPPSVINALPVAQRQNGEFELRNIRAGAYDLFPVAPVLQDPVPGAAPAAAPGTAAAGVVAGATVIQSINGQIVSTVAGAPGVPMMRRQPTSRNPIDVTRDLADLRITVSAGVPLSGEVILNGPGSSAIKPESIRLNLRNLDSMPQAFITLIGTIPVDAAGKFAIQGVPEARYTLQITGIPNTAYVADIRYGGVSAMDNGFVLDASATPVQVIIETGGATLQGVVLNSENKPAASATVAIVPPTARRQNTLLYKNVTTDEEGKFTIRGIAPGTYTVFAWESILQSAWQNAEYLQRYEGRGRGVNISANGVSEVQLNVIPADAR